MGNELRARRYVHGPCALLARSWEARVRQGPTCIFLQGCGYGRVAKQFTPRPGQATGWLKKHRFGLVPDSQVKPN